VKSAQTTAVIECPLDGEPAEGGSVLLVNARRLACAKHLQNFADEHLSPEACNADQTKKPRPSEIGIPEIKRLVPWATCGNCSTVLLKYLGRWVDPLYMPSAWIANPSVVP